jgi:hypothetical protein
MSVNPIGPKTDLFEGVDLLRTLIQSIIQGPSPKANEGRSLESR